MARASGAWVIALGLGGCFVSGRDDAAEGGGESFMQDDIPSTNCQGTGTSESGGCMSSESTSTTEAGSGDDSCRVSTECAAGEACIAPFDGERGPFACVPGCIGIMDEASWCGDAAACCDAGATCTLRGYCVLDGDGGSSSGDGGSSDSGGSSGTG